MDFLYLAAGGALLWAGGELLVRGSARLAGTLGVRPLVIGLTVVAFGTSSPELAASIVAAFRDAHDLVLGNVIGSNTLNIGLILGVTALIRPVQSRLAIIRRELPIMIGVCLLPLPIVANGVISRLEGGLLLFLLAAYLFLLIRSSRLPWGDEEFTTEYGPRPGKMARPVAFAAVGVGLLVVGAKLLVDGGVGIALHLGVPERIVGLTVVALGTSLPELASSIVAALRDEGDIVLGNLVGSSIFNILAILGITAMIHPIRSSTAGLVGDIWVMVAVGILALVLLATGKRLSRWKGALLVAAWLTYLVFIFR